MVEEVKPPKPKDLNMDPSLDQRLDSLEWCEDEVRRLEEVEGWLGVELPNQP